MTVPNFDFRSPGAGPRWLHNSRGTAQVAGVAVFRNLALAPDGCITAAEQPGGRSCARRQTRPPDAVNATPGTGRAFRIAKEPRRHPRLPTIMIGRARPPSRDSRRAPEESRRERVSLSWPTTAEWTGSGRARSCVLSGLRAIFPGLPAR